MRVGVVLMALLLAACGPQLGSLQRGEEGRVVRAYNGDTIVLDSGLRVFLAEVDAPRGDDPYAGQAQGELDALVLHRDVLLAYGGSQRWIPPARRDDQLEPPPETAIAHVFVKSEGGRWFWLQHELVARGAVIVRPRHNNHARTADLLDVESQARAAERGLWAQREYRPLNTRAAAQAALAVNDNCLRGGAPFRIVEARVAEARVFDRRAALRLDGAPEDAPFSVVVFGESFSGWDGPALASLTGARIRVRGPLGVYQQQPQLCLDHASELEILGES